ETMDREIIAASDNGADFFAILWYYNDPGSEREPHSTLLNTGLDCFIKSPESGRMKFMIEFCNSPPYDVKTPDQWQDCMNTWISAMRHPSYLRVDGKLVFKVHGAHYYYAQNNKDLSQCKAKLDELRERVRQAGLGEMLIGGGVSAIESIKANDPIAQLFDFTGTYMDVPPHVQRPQNYPYEMLADFARTARRVHSYDAIPYMPYLAGSWNPRPWRDPRASFEFPTFSQWKEELLCVRNDLIKYENLGLPLAGGAKQKMFTIYAWNEFGEGGIVAPTKGDGYMKIKAIKEIFGRNSSK
ncbi:MAG TPA: hypothetical protein VIJ25_14025, partial [Methylococcales bacterium]